MVQVTVITPTVRPQSLIVVQNSLMRQTLKPIEWIIVSPKDIVGSARYADGWIQTKERIDHGIIMKWIEEPDKKEGDFYSLNKAYNEGFRQAKGELVISYQDGIQIQPDCLERFWYWHEYHKGKSCIGAVGDQFSSLNPPVKVWSDPRRSEKFGTHYEIIPLDLEYSLCAIPRQAIIDSGGLDEKFDQYAATSEKEMNYRMDKLGYKFYISQDIEYKAIKHPRLSEDWDKHYFAGIPYYQKCLEEIDAGSRLCLDFVK